jgi:hypothetical protein
MHSINHSQFKLALVEGIPNWSNPLVQTAVRTAPHSKSGTGKAVPRTSMIGNQKESRLVLVRVSNLAPLNMIP